MCRQYYLEVGDVVYRIDSTVELRMYPEDAYFMVDSSDEADYHVSVSVRKELPSLDDMEIDFEDISLQAGRDEMGNSVHFYRAPAAQGQPVYAFSRKQGKEIVIIFREAEAYYQHPLFRIWNLLHMEETLAANQALILHACFLEYRGEAILLTAPSGTGKTTHGKLWEKYAQEKTGADRAVIRNGDKVCLRMIDGRWYACGYPFHGSADECDNVTLPIKAILVIRQAPADRILPLSVMEQYKILMEQCTIPQYARESAMQSLELVEQLIAGGPQMRALECTMNRSAFETSYEYLYGEESNESV